jgi:tRNA G18 (ribose-2'-O)-methylase SpoU
MAIRKLTHEEILRPSLDEIHERPRLPVTLVVDNVRSLYNVGSLFRSCDGAFIEKMYLCGFTPYPPRKEISKTALGATESVPWQYAWDIGEVLRHLRDQNTRIAALEHTDRSISCFDLGTELFPLAIVIGNEITGLSKTALELCDLALEIPMYGIKQSLNVAVAAGIALFECVRILGGMKVEG